MRTKQSAYLSPTKSFTLANIDRDDRIHYERVAQSSENLRRAMMRYYFKRNGWQ